MARKYFPFYESFFEGAQDLPDKQRLKFYDAVAKYALFDEEPNLTGMALTCWKFAKPNIDNFTKNYDSGLKGGRPAKTTVSPMDKTPVLPIGETYKDKEKDKEKDKDKEREKEKEKESQAADAAGAPDRIPCDVFSTFSNGDGELLQALRDYDQMRREKRKALTDTMRRSLCQQLDEEFQPCEWVEIVKQATRQGWLKFYPLDKERPTATQTTTESGSDQLSRIINNLRQRNGV